MLRTRFIKLCDYTGTPVCPPILVSLPETTYEPSESEWELNAIKIAVRDGVLAPEARHTVHASFDGDAPHRLAS
jgi:hypothetical protein